MAFNYLTQTWSATPAGDLTNAVGNELIATLCPNGSGGIDTTAAEAAITDAEHDADSLLGPGFVVPVTTGSSTVIKRAVVDMVVFYMYDRRPEFILRGGDNPAQKRYDRAKKVLEEVRNGKRTLGRETEPARTETNGGVVYHTDTGFIVDADEGTGPSGPF